MNAITTGAWQERECYKCGVTWRGKPGDKCWNCEADECAVEAVEETS